MTVRRLYPVKFRNADFDSQFKKYEVIRINGAYQHVNDNRPESFRPRQDELEHVEQLDTGNNWQRRRMILDGLIGATTMCELLDRNPKGGMAIPSPSTTVTRGMRPRRRRSTLPVWPCQMGHHRQSVDVVGD